MNEDRRIYIWIVFGLILVGVFFTLRSATEKLAPKDQSVATSPVAQTAATHDPNKKSAVRALIENLKSDNSNGMLQSPSCKVGEAANLEPLILSPKLASKIERVESSEFIMFRGEYQNCYRTGVEHSIVVSYRDSDEKFRIAMIPQGTAQLIGMKLRELTSLSSSEIQNFNSHNPELYKMLSEDKSGKHEKVLILKFRKNNPSFNSPPDAVPTSHPMAQTISFADTAELVREGAHMFASPRKKSENLARSIAHLQLIRIKGDRDLAYDFYDRKEIERISGLSHSFFQEFHGAPMIFIGEDARDYIPYNLITLAAHSGKAKIYWVREGWNPQKIPRSVTPLDSSSVKVLNADQIAKKLNEFMLIDTRAIEDFQKRRPTGALNLPFSQALDQEGVPVFKPISAIPQDFVAKSEGFIGLNLSNVARDRKLLILGRNEYDWSAYKEAMIFRQSGYDAYWFRAGWKGWIYSSKIAPELFPISKTVGP